MHQALLERQQLPAETKTEKIWRQRFEQINNFEKYLVENGIIVIPADRKWFTRLAVGTVIYLTLESLGLKYPTVTEEHRQALLKAKELLENEEQ